MEGLQTKNILFLLPLFFVVTIVSSMDFETTYTGSWEVVVQNAGIACMHMIVTPANKAIFLDSTNLGPSQLKATPAQGCFLNPNGKFNDCTAHSLEFDVQTNKIRPLKTVTNTWCSSGGLGVDGNLVHTGGYVEGARVVRYLKNCPTSTCDFEERQLLADGRWYATQQMLPDGRIFVIGGRRAFSYEFVPTTNTQNAKSVGFPFLRDTTASAEDNLYPFVHLSTDGNLFIFANNRSVLLDYNTNKIIREFPPLTKGSYKYPSSGQSALLPLDLAVASPSVEVIICGGAESFAFWRAGKSKIYDPAFNVCYRMDIRSENPTWKTELMPKPRVMADLLVLPTGDLLFVNGASRGSSGWGYARDPVLEPWLYKPNSPAGQRFKVLKPTTIPRMYHSSSAVLPDGKVLIAGSNTNDRYVFDSLYPTELRVEKFSPPYLAPELAVHRPELSPFPAKISYGLAFKMSFKLAETVSADELKVTMYAPPFTTHGYSQGQRMLKLKVSGLAPAGAGSHTITVATPLSSNFAPPGYYMVFLVYRGVPSKAVWVQIK